MKILIIALTLVSSSCATVGSGLQVVGAGLSGFASAYRPAAQVQVKKRDTYCSTQVLGTMATTYCQ